MQRKRRYDEVIGDGLGATISVFEDSRKIMQVLPAPELRAITARPDALEKRFEEAERRQQPLIAAIHGLANDNVVIERLDRLESKSPAEQ